MGCQGLLFILVYLQHPRCVLQNSTCPCDVLEPCPVGPGEGPGSGPPNQTSRVEGCLPRGPHTPLAALASATKGSFRVPNVFSEITLSPALLWVDSKWWWSTLGMLTHTAPQREPESLRVGGSPPRTEAEPTTTWGA